MQRIKRIGAHITLAFVFMAILLPTFSYSAQSADTKAGKTGLVYECGDDKTAGECTFADLMAAVSKVVNFMITLALTLSVAVIAYAGFLYMKSGDNAGERTKANKMLQKSAIGIGLSLAAWLIVKLIFSALGADTGGISF